MYTNTHTHTHTHTHVHQHHSSLQLVCRHTCLLYYHLEQGSPDGVDGQSSSVVLWLFHWTAIWGDHQTLLSSGGHTQTHVCTHSHTYTRAHTATHTHMHTQPHIHTHAHTATHTHTCTHSHTYTHMHTQPHIHTCTHIMQPWHMHMYTQPHIHTCTHIMQPWHMHMYKHTFDMLALCACEREWETVTSMEALNSLDLPSPPLHTHHDNSLKHISHLAQASI